MNRHLSTSPGAAGRASTQAERSEAVLIICALAWKGNPLLGRDATEHYARRARHSTLHHHTRDEILAWRRNFLASEQRNRWRVAKQWAIDLLNVPGAEHVPDEPCPAGIDLSETCGR